MKTLKGLIGLLMIGILYGTTQGQPLNFEDLAVGSQYMETDSFMTGGFKVDVTGFLAGSTPTSGLAEVDFGNDADGLGNDNELEVNNVNVQFQVGSVTLFSFLFGEYGGEVNLQINGDFRKLGDFDDVDGMMVGGVMISAGPSGVAGSVFTASGTINEIIFGGQELWVDDIRFTPVPAPSTAVLTVLGALMMHRRRR